MHGHPSTDACLWNAARRVCHDAPAGLPHTDLSIGRQLMTLPFARTPCMSTLRQSPTHCLLRKSGSTCCGFTKALGNPPYVHGMHALPALMNSVLPKNPDTSKVRLRFAAMHNIKHRLLIPSAGASSGNNTWPMTHVMAAASHSGLLSHKHVRRAQQLTPPWATNHMHVSRLTRALAERQHADADAGAHREQPSSPRPAVNRARRAVASLPCAEGRTSASRKTPAPTRTEEAPPAES